MNTLNVSNIIGKIRKIKVLLEIVTRKYYLTTDIRHNIFKKYTFCHAGFCRIINAFSRVLDVNVIIFLLNNCN